MLQLLFVSTAIMQRTDTGRDLLGPERLAAYIATAFALVPKKTTAATINPANRGMFIVSHILSPLYPIPN
jgi:hypothetical protein